MVLRRFQRAVAVLGTLSIALAACEKKTSANTHDARDSPPSAARSGKASITGFLEVPFGATRQQVIARLGQPKIEVSWREMGTSLSYPPRTLFDEQAEPNLVVHPREGLVQGNYLVRVYDFRRSCEVVYRQLAEAVTARYPRIKPEQKRSQEGGGRFCDAVLDGRASALTRLADPANGATVRVIVQPGRPFIDVIYVSAVGQRINDAMSERELRTNF